VRAIEMARNLIDCTPLPSKFRFELGLLMSYYILIWFGFSALIWNLLSILFIMRSHIMKTMPFDWLLELKTPEI